MANNTAQGKTLEKKGFKLPISGNALVLLVALVLVTAIFSALNPNYFTYGNFINILVSSTLIGLTSIGMTFLIMTGGSDLSAGSVAAFGGVFIAWGLKNTGLNWVVLVLIVIVRNIYVVQQSKAYVVERLGAFHSVWGVGLHLKVPFIERVVKKVSLKEQVADFDPQPVITKDNVTMQIDTVIYFQITDPKLYTYGVEYPMNAIENLTATTLRNIIGELELDQSLTSRDTINAKMRAILDEATDPWGIKVNRVELKNILPPREIQNAMEKQMKAERERRESILQAEGEKASKILVAEGEKQSAILKADAAKQARIMAAEAEATSIMKVQQALADAMRMLNENAPNDQVIKLKSLEALQKMADGKATKIIIPSEIQGLAGLAASAKTLLESDPPQE